jgi:hypothetical protein
VDDPIVELAQIRSRGKAPPKPTINIVPGERHRAADQGIQALVAAKVPVYQRNRKIVRIALVKAKSSDGQVLMVPGIVEVDRPMMERELGRSALWQRYHIKQKKDVAIDPPSPVASQILAMAGEWPFAPLRGIIQSATLRRRPALSLVFV